MKLRFDDTRFRSGHQNYNEVFAADHEGCQASVVLGITNYDSESGILAKKRSRVACGRNRNDRAAEHKRWRSTLWDDTDLPEIRLRGFEVSQY